MCTTNLRPGHDQFMSDLYVKGIRSGCIRLLLYEFLHKLQLWEDLCDIEKVTSKDIQTIKRRESIEKEITDFLGSALRNRTADFKTDSVCWYAYVHILVDVSNMFQTHFFSTSQNLAIVFDTKWFEKLIFRTYIF